MNPWVFGCGMIVGIITYVGVSDLGWPAWIPAAAYAVILATFWLGKDYRDARRCRKQQQEEEET